MGTTYSVKIVLSNDLPVDLQSLKDGIDSILTRVNQQMSTYIPDSEISRFNRWDRPEPFRVSREFAAVVNRANQISEMTDGAFDITIMPLVNFWGFGPLSNEIRNLPEDYEIEQLLTIVGYQKLKIRGQSLVKSDKNIQIDLSAIAKGFGVDTVFEFLRTKRFDRFLVEIGGEVRCVGTNVKNLPWRIGIDRPGNGTLPGESIQAIIALKEMAMATSGDYRNFIELDGEIYSHTINPRTGYPPRNGVASATVIASNCMDADALATALMVLGEERGMNLVESLEGVEALVIIREEGNRFRTVQSSTLELSKD